MNIRISVRRFHPDSGEPPRWQEYEISHAPRMTVLEALLQIYEHLDPTLAFRFGCRFSKCGLCAVEVNGRPRMACFTEVRDGMRIGPLGRMPVIRDLVVDRAGFFDSLRALEMYIPDSQTPPGTPAVVRCPEEREKLLLCVECLACNATCPETCPFDPGRAGPYVFVKLAQLHFDPRDTTDRRAQARKLGIERCLECRRCYCINGLDIHRDAIAVLASAYSSPQEHLCRS